MQFDDRPDFAKRLEQARVSRGFLNAKDATRRFGWTYETYIQHEQGIRGISRAARKYADAFKVSEAWLLTGEGDLAIREVPLVGYVGAGATAHFYGDGQGPIDMVPAPDDATPTTVAVEIRGESLGSLFDQWIVYYDEVRAPVTPDMINRLCVVGLPDDRVLVKKITRSRSPGLYHLLSNTEGPIFDVEIIWAAKVKSMVPR